MAITNYWSTAASVASNSQIVVGSPPASLSVTNLTLSQFMNWSLADQAAYINANGSGSPKTITIGTAPTAVNIQFSSATGKLLFPSNANLPAPETIHPDDFLVWTRESQLAYINAVGTGSPKTIYLGATAPNGTKAQIVANATLDLKVGSSTGELFTISDQGRAATATEKATAPTLLDPAVFLAWTDAERLAYVNANKGTGTSVLVGPGTPKIYAALADDVSTNAGVIQHTSGDYEPIPYFFLNGSSNGTPSSIVATSAEYLFPALDGAEHKLDVADRPTAFYTDTHDLNTDADRKAFIADFAKWHTAYQLEYVRKYGTLIPADTVNNVPAYYFLELKASLDTGQSAVISPDDPTKLFIVESLDKAAIARMSQTEQRAVADTGAFADMRSQLGLAIKTTASLGPLVKGTNGGTYTAGTSSLTPEGYVDALIAEIDTTRAPNRSNTLLAPEARDALRQQLNILKEQIAASYIVSPADIKKKVDEIQTRFNRLFAFYNVRSPAETTGYLNETADSDHDIAGDSAVYYTHVISTDGSLATVQKGYAVFLAQEQRIAELAEARMQLVRDNGSLNGKKLDVPYLVYKFQSLYNLALEAEVVSETEEVNQRNDLLKTYAAIQDIVNQTLAKFETADDTKKYLLGLDQFDYGSLTASQKYTISMFEDLLGSGQKHPIEVLGSLSRPLSEFYAQSGHGSHYHFWLAEGTHTQWSTIGTRLSETVTLINQNSQIKMNDINSLDKERNRHFELANNALSKMADIINNIARATG